MWIHHDHTYQLHLDNDATITTTADHPFWSHTTNQWQPAATLTTGDQLTTAATPAPITAAAGTATITSSLHQAGPTTTVYNLTTTGPHTYHVTAGNTPVLVHNTSKPCGTGIADELATLGPGKQSTVRTVSSEAELRTLYDKWSDGGIDITPKSYDGTMVQLPDGTVVGWRNGSLSGGATIDIRLPGVTRPRRVHVDGH